MSGMSKKHFVAIAKAFKHRVDYLDKGNGVNPQIVSNQRLELQILANDLADVFHTLNPEFRRQTFMDACGFTETRHMKEGELIASWPLSRAEKGQA